jgi:DNA-binding winged helix-turn-helix (wHTH) protein
VQFLFADHVLDTDRRELRRGGEGLAVEPQVFDLLVYLVGNRDRVVSKDDLIGAVWGGRVVSDSTLTSRINAARKAIGDSGEQQKLIRTVARKGLPLSARCVSSSRAAKWSRRETTLARRCARPSPCQTARPSPYCRSPT